MRTFLSLALNFIVVYATAQNVIPDSLKKVPCDIIGKNNVIKNIELWNEVGDRIEYKENNSLKDFLISDVLRIEFSKYFVILNKQQLVLVKEYDKLNGFDDSKGYAYNIKPDGFLFSKKGSNSEKYYNAKFNFATEGKILFNSGVINEVKNQFIPKDTTQNNKAENISTDYVIEDIVSPGKGNKEINLNVNGFLDAETSYLKGVEDGKQSVDKFGFTAISCLAIGCVGPFAPSVLNMEPNPPRPELIPKNVNEKMYLEGYKDGKIKARRKPMLYGALSYVGGVIIIYAYIIVSTLNNI